MNAADLLIAATKEKSPVCVGLDPRMEKFPDAIEKDVEGMLKFNIGIIDAVKDIAACVKPQSAFYELYGAEGVAVLWETAHYAKSQGLVVILDAKRNDIGSTCEAYADAYLGQDSPFDWLTVTPYLGSDGIVPFVDRCTKNAKGIFVLVKTSNPSSGDVQDLPTGDEAVHEHVAQLVEGWGRACVGPESKMSSVGAVVGATYPEELKYLRTLMPQSPLLIPGYGAQGGEAADIAHGFIGGIGAVVNSSRGIIHASSGPDWQDAAHKAALEMAGDLQKALG